MKKLLLLCTVVGVLGACATMTKSGMTPQSKAKDRYACEQQAYKAAHGNPLLVSNGLYRDCMRARRLPLTVIGCHPRIEPRSAIGRVRPF